MNNVSAPLITIVGPTASGKTALALELAERFNGEIICADSRTIYRDMNIGTAKPTKIECARVPHHMLDVVNPDQQYSASQFKDRAMQLIDEIHQRGKTPFLVGGTGLYIDSVLYDYTFGPKASNVLREKLTKRTIEDLQDEIKKRGITMPENYKNKRYLVRALEMGKKPISNRATIRSNSLVLGISVERSILVQRIADRVDAMIDAGLIDELTNLLKKYDSLAPGFQSTCYRAFIPFLQNKIDFESAKKQFILNDTHLAKRQQTWFKRNNSIHWVNDRSEAVEIVTTFLNK